MNPILIWMLIFAIVMILPITVLNFIMQGFLFRYLKVFLSRGRLTLVCVDSVSDSYFRTGSINETHLSFKSRNKDKNLQGKQVPVEKGAVQRWMGINVIEYDEVRNCIITPEKELYETTDPQKTDSIMKRIAMLPHMPDKNMLLILVLGLVVVAAIAGFAAFMGFQNNKLLEELIKKGAEITTSGTI